MFTTLDKYRNLQCMAMNAQGNMVRARWSMEGGCIDGEGELLRHTQQQQQQQGVPAASPLTPLTQQQSATSLFSTDVTAITWGVVSGHKGIQPTISSLDSFSRVGRSDF